MPKTHSVLFLTDRGRAHQQAALAAAPAELAVTILRRRPKQEVLRHIAGADFLISERSGEVDAEMISAGKRLQLIQRLGSLTYDIDGAAAQEARIPVSAWPVLGCIMVAEHMMLQTLALVKRLNEVTAIAKAAGDWGLPSRRTDEDTFAYNWSGRHGIGRIRDQTVGILGMGEIGAELARRLRGFAPRRLLYTKRARLPEQAETELGIVYATMDELVADSDMLCNLLPYAPNTDGLLGAGFFSQMKAGAILVSCGSGSVINEGALAAALRSGHLAGAALDTFEWEPLLPDNPLLPLARDPAVNLVLTPHVAAGGSTPPGADPPRRQDYENILRVLAGEPILYRVA